jgi:penicillin amidase
VKWLGFGVTHEARAYYDLSRAGSFADFKAALNHFEAGLLNFIYAGTDGDIGYYPHSVYPIRARLDPMNPPYGVVPGDGGYEWTGASIPDECIPQLHNPDSCRVFSANNDPAGVTANGDVLGARFYLGGTFDYGLRAREIRDRLDALSGGGATPDDFVSMQGDVHSVLARHFLPPLMAAVAGAPLSRAAQALADILVSWDAEDAASETGPTVLYAWYSQLLVDVFSDDLPLTFADVATDDRLLAPTLAHLLAGESAPSKHDYLNGKSAEAVMLAALEEVAVSIPAALGPDPLAWTWGAAHTQTFDHPLGGRYNLGPVRMGGGLATLYDARYAPAVNGSPVVQPDVNEASNARIVVELLPGGVTMRSILPTGESGVLGDTHYVDQLASWLAARDVASPFARADVVARTAQVTTFPAGFPGP